jgi:hypothetical protein
MKLVSFRSLTVSSLMLFAVVASGQERDRDDDRRRNEDRYHQQERNDSWWAGHLFQRVREDIDHVQAVTFPFSADQYRLTTVKRELNELQDKYAATRYDQPQLDDVIAALQRVMSDNHLAGRDRDMLSEDLNRLREFREHHDGYR